MELAVSVKNIRKSFGSGELRNEVLHGIDLDVKKGELLMLVGPSGSGKTTLISIITGVLSFDEGECHIMDQDFGAISDKDKTAFRGKNIGYVFQAFNLIPMFKAVENAAIPLILNGTARQEAFEKAKERLSQLGLKKRVNAFPRQLSGGEQQRVAIARAVIHSPQLIVCDEPTSSLDQENGKRIMEHLREVVTKENKTLIVVTHDPRIFEFADRIVYLEDGNIVKQEEKKHSS